VANGRYKYTPPAGKSAGLAEHFLTSDLPVVPDFGRDTFVPTDLFVLSSETTVLAEKESAPRLAVHPFGKGRSVYLAGFKFTPENTRLLHRALFWAASREAAWGPWQSTNVKTEATYFAKAGKLVVINNAGTDETTTVTLADGKTAKPVQLPAHGIQILDV